MDGLITFVALPELDRGQIYQKHRAARADITYVRALCMWCFDGLSRPVSTRASSGVRTWSRFPTFASYLFVYRGYLQASSQTLALHLTRSCRVVAQNSRPDARYAFLLRLPSLTALALGLVLSQLAHEDGRLTDTAIVFLSAMEARADTDSEEPTVTGEAQR